jgi:hypothetical protein
MYGGGALLIREVARRAGRGWPTMLLLAVAYGVLQPGLLDQSLFNPSYEGYDFQSAAHVPALGISAHWATTFVGGHAVWSIAVPIAVVETLVPERRTTPWLGRAGLTVTVVVFLLGATVIFRDQTEQFLATVPQMAGTAAATTALIAAAFAVGRRPRAPVDRPAPRPWRWPLPQPPRNASAARISATFLMTASTAVGRCRIFSAVGRPRTPSRERASTPATARSTSAGRARR